MTVRFYPGVTQKRFSPTVKPQQCKALRSRNSARDHRLLKPTKQASQCLSTWENYPRGNFCFVWSSPKNRCPPHPALLPPSFPPSLPMLEIVETACPQLSVTTEKPAQVISYHYQEKLRRPTCLEILSAQGRSCCIALRTIELLEGMV